MGDCVGKIASGVNCSVVGCTGTAIRSISVEKAKSGGLDVPADKRVYLCKPHYKELKKKTRKEKMIEKLRWMG